MELLPRHCWRVMEAEAERAGLVVPSNHLETMVMALDKTPVGSPRKLKARFSSGMFCDCTERESVCVCVCLCLCVCVSVCLCVCLSVCLSLSLSLSLSRLTPLCMLDNQH